MCLQSYSSNTIFSLVNATNSSTVIWPIFSPDLDLTDTALFCSSLSPTISTEISVTDTLLNMLTHIATETPSIIVQLHSYMRMVRWLIKIDEDYGKASARLWSLLGEYAEQTKNVQELYYIYKHMRDLAKIDGIDPAPYEELRQDTIKLLQNAN